MPPTATTQPIAAVRDAYASESPDPVEVFISYAHTDEPLKDKLVKMLSPLERSGAIKIWQDRKIIAGELWADAIDRHIRSAQIILFLVSPDFIASDYCFDIEVKIAMQRHANDDAIAMPIILRPCVWDRTRFSICQALPRDGKPVIEWPKQDRALKEIAVGIEKAIGGSRRRPPAELGAGFHAGGRR
jgi:hypothetical protein